MKALIRSHTDHGAYELDGEVPETSMTGQTADIINICVYQWYQWLMFCNQPITYPDLLVVMGRYLGLDADVGSTMTFFLLLLLFSTGLRVPMACV